MPREGEAPHVVMLHNRYLLLHFQTVPAAFLLQEENYRQHPRLTAQHLLPKPGRDALHSLHGD